MGRAKPSKSAKELFAKNRGVNLLAGARVFLFGARDVWFVVGLPVFLYASGWSFTMVGAFLAGLQETLRRAACGKPNRTSPAPAA